MSASVWVTLSFPFRPGNRRAVAVQFRGPLTEQELDTFIAAVQARRAEFLELPAPPPRLPQRRTAVHGFGGDHG